MPEPISTLIFLFFMLCLLAGMRLCARWLMSNTFARLSGRPPQSFSAAQARAKDLLSQNVSANPKAARWISAAKVAKWLGIALIVCSLAWLVFDKQAATSSTVFLPGAIGLLFGAGLAVFAAGSIAQIVLEYRTLRESHHR